MKTLIAGTFDNFHVGHQWLLWEAWHPEDRLVVIVARDQTVADIKGQLPKNTEEERLKRVQRELKDNNVKVRLGREDKNFWKTISEETPDRILLGYDQRFNEDECREKFPDIQIERVTAYQPEFFKSSKF